MDAAYRLGPRRARIEPVTHAERGWAIEDIAPDFRLMDVWEIPIDARRDDFDAFLGAIAVTDPREGGLAGALFRVRERLGARLGLDEPGRAIPGSPNRSLRERLPARFLAHSELPVMPQALVDAGFRPLYRTEDEWAAEISNATVHGVLHLAWFEHAPNRWRPSLAVYVRPRGITGRLYLIAIQPFRHLIVYPALIRRLVDSWRSQQSLR